MEAFTQNADEGSPLVHRVKPTPPEMFLRTIQILLAVSFVILIGLVIQISLVSVPKKSQEGNNLQQLTPNLMRGGDKSEENPIVKISSGKVKGVVLNSREGRTYNAFYNMPYAEPPVGKYKFEPPRPLNTRWRGVFDGTERGTAETECLQFKGSKVSGKEDCLKLSVFTPQLPRNNRKRNNPKLPVMFYILGGAYVFGRANRYGAEYLMDEDVVLVMIDYRYGPFGHLNTEDEVIRGNMAFKDQVMALKWVQENIEKFGGDPKKVLIFGNSSGAASVHAHILSNMTEGLFQRAISQSGTVMLEPGYLTRPRILAQNLGESLNCTDVLNSTLLLQCLVEADPEKVALYYSFQDDNYHLTKEAIPSNGDTSDVFMGEIPALLLEQGKFKKIPWMLGSNSAESFSSALKKLKNLEEVNELNTNWDLASSTLFAFENDRNASKRFRDFYFQGRNISNDTRYELVDSMSDVEWVFAVWESARLHAKYGAPTYAYWLSQEPIESHAESSKEGFKPPYGVAHADEVQFLFPFDVFPTIGLDSRDLNFSKEMVKIWTGFARTGVPTVPSGETWLPLNLTSGQTKWMELNQNGYKLTDILKPRMEFLNTMPFKDPNYVYRDSW